MTMELKPATTELDASVPDVLVVDDDAPTREGLLERLQQMGLVAIAASDGSEALRLARDRAPRLVLLDLQMPVLNGWQFLERRRRDRRLRRIPVVVMSDLSGDWVATYGAEAQLDKPVDEAALGRILDRFVARTPVPVVAPPAEDGPTVLVVEDDDDTRTSVVELLEEHGYHVVSASNGQEAEDLLRSIERPDCIVLDLWMPVMNGWSFVSRLHQFEPPIPMVVVITAAEPYWGYPVPLSHVLRKPLHPDTLLGIIRKVVAPPAESPAPAASAAAGGQVEPRYPIGIRPSSCSRG